MRVMQLNRRWRRSTDTESYIFSLNKLLEEHGHEIIPFAVQDSGNEPSDYSALFVSPLELTNPFRRPVHKIFGTAARLLYSREARNRISILADTTHPHVAHVHNIYLHITPSVLPPLARRGVGIVMTVHNAKLFCPAIVAYRDGEECHRCRPYHYLPCVTGRCFKGSSLASSICAIEQLAHDTFHAYTDRVDCFIAPSRHMVDRLLARGIQQEQVAHIPYFVDIEKWTLSAEKDEGYVLFGGTQLNEEELQILIEAFSQMPDVPLKIAATGNMDQNARELAWDMGADNIEVHGYKTEDEMVDLVAGSRLFCVPGEYSSFMPLIVLKALASGKPVIAARGGHVAEFVRDGITGRLTEAGDVEGIKSAVMDLWEDPSRCREMGLEARKRAEEDYSPAVHYESIIKLYRKVKKV